MPEAVAKRGDALPVLLCWKRSDGKGSGFRCCSETQRQGRELRTTRPSSIPWSCPAPTLRFGELSPSPKLSRRAPSKRKSLRRAALPVSSPAERRWQAERVPRPQSIHRLLIHFITAYFHRPAETPLFLGQRFPTLPQHRRFLALQLTGSQGSVLLLSLMLVLADPGFWHPQRGQTPPPRSAAFCLSKVPTRSQEGEAILPGSC